MIRFSKNLLTALIISLLFFTQSLVTISDYGISWDEPIHFFRGQAYLHYFITGEKQFTNVSGNRSYFQSDTLPAEYFFENDSGHPPLNGILAALTNYIFYQQLGILGDIESHHLFNIFISSLMIFMVVLFASETIGRFGGITAGLSLILYPLFFAESKFNIKDPAEAAFFTLTIYTYWRAIKDKSWRWLLISALSFGLGLSTKFNILFLPFILIPWTIYKILYLDKFKFGFDKKFYLALLFSPFLVLIIFFGCWPFLWHDSLNNLMEIVGYYKQIGSGFNHQTSEYYLKFGINSYAPLWILYTTPPYLIFLSVIGSIYGLINFKRKDGAILLWLIWFIIPILRVVLPGTSIYGGVRQLMEYIPAMALLSGYGAVSIKKLIEKNFPFLNQKLILVLFFLGFLEIAVVLYKIHPNENVYFNSLIGGLSGAKAKEIPSWGNSFGNAYLPAIKWFNTNAESGAQLGLIQGTALNVPKIMLRDDLNFNNISWSGINRNGEYMMELTHQNPVKAYPYAWDYIENVLNPVYEVKVDGVAIAKLWKNDLAHSKKQFQRPESEIEIEKIERLNNDLIIKLEQTVNLTRLTINYDPLNCEKPKGKVSLSTNGIDYKEEPDQYPNEFVTEKNKQPNTIYQYFAVPEASFIKFSDSSENSCIFDYKFIHAKGFK